MAFGTWVALIGPSALSIISQNNRSSLQFLKARCREGPVMRISLLAIAAAAAMTAGTAPANAQSSEEIILADPAFSLTFSASYIASDLDLWGKHGIKVKTV